MNLILFSLIRKRERKQMSKMLTILAKDKSMWRINEYSLFSTWNLHNHLKFFKLESWEKRKNIHKPKIIDICEASLIKALSDALFLNFVHEERLF